LQLVQAYDTLKDDEKRKEYDIIYPLINRTRAGQQSTQGPQTSPASAQRSQAHDDAVQIAALHRMKQERLVRWANKQRMLELEISELEKPVWRLEQEIRTLASIAAAEASAEASKNSWTTWLLSPLYKQKVETEDEKAERSRRSQERMVEKSLKERRVCSQKDVLQSKRWCLKQAKQEKEAADLRDNRMIQTIDARIRDREAKELARSQAAGLEILRDIQRRHREQQEAQAARARQQAREEELREQASAYERRSNSGYNVHPHANRSTDHQGSTSTCSHAGWWDKVLGRTACPECYDVWNYLLQCPSCRRRACPKCQRRMRPSFAGNRAMPNRRPAQTSYYDGYDSY